jgi:hypothetical protein
VKHEDTKIGGYESGPVITEFRGDPDLGQKHVHQARVLLGYLKQAMQRGGLKAHKAYQELQDGTKLYASSNMWGLASIDAILIDVTGKKSTVKDKCIGFIVHITNNTRVEFQQATAVVKGPGDGVGEWLDVDIRGNIGSSYLEYYQCTQGVIPGTLDNFDDGTDAGEWASVMYADDIHHYDSPSSSNFRRKNFIDHSSAHAPIVVRRNKYQHIAIDAKWTISGRDINFEFNRVQYLEESSIAVLPGKTTYNFKDAVWEAELGGGIITPYGWQALVRQVDVAVERTPYFPSFVPQTEPDVSPWSPPENVIGTTFIRDYTYFNLSHNSIPGHWTSTATIDFAIYYETYGVKFDNYERVYRENPDGSFFYQVGYDATSTVDEIRTDTEYWPHRPIPAEAGVPNGKYVVQARDCLMEITLFCEQANYVKKYTFPHAREKEIVIDIGAEFYSVDEIYTITDFGRDNYDPTYSRTT